MKITVFIAEIYLFSHSMGRDVTSLNDMDLQVAAQTFSYLCFELVKCVKEI
jgi:hypothetical protein